MRNNLIIRSLVPVFAMTLLGSVMFSCVDSDYDVSEDIDMTVGLGSDGLKFKLGSTQKIMMKNVLEVDNDFKTDATNMYYLIKKGDTQYDFNVSAFSSNVDDVNYTTDSPVITYSMLTDILPGGAGSIDINKGTVIDIPEPVKAAGTFKYTAEGIKDEIISVKRVSAFEGTKVKVVAKIKIQGTDFGFKDVKNMKVTFPEYLEIANFTGGSISGNTLIVNDLTNVSGDELYLGEAEFRSVNPNEKAISADRTLTLSSDVSFTSDFSFQAMSDFTVSEGDKCDVSVVFSVTDHNGNHGNVSIKSAEGRFNPVIDPAPEDIEVLSSLPDFLKDDEVTITVSNPTVKFVADMSEISVPMEFNMNATSRKNNAETANVWFPAKDSKAKLHKNMLNTLYFHESEEGPYDPEGVAGNSDKYMIDNISSLVHKLPDYINIDLSNRKVNVDNSETSYIELDRNYRFSAGYDVYVPFQFDAGLKIVYNDSIEDLHDDLQDYEADSAAVSATIENTVPLDLDLEIIPVDLGGNELSCIHIDKVKINAAKGSEPTDTEVYLNIRLDNRSDLKKLDKLMLRVSAQSIDNGLLTSEQYIQIKDIRLILKGQVVCDFN